YRAHGRMRHVLAWGAVNARASKAGMLQTEFEVDYAGGWGKYYVADPTVRALQSRFRRLRFTKGYLVSPTVKALSARSASARTSCLRPSPGTARPYAGPPLAWFVTACTAPDGSYWAVQAWQRALPNYGLPATPKQAVSELRLSHWSGPLPVLTIDTDW